MPQPRYIEFGNHNNAAKDLGRRMEIIAPNNIQGFMGSAGNFPGMFSRNSSGGMCGEDFGANDPTNLNLLI